MFLVLAVFFALPSVLALSCVGISQGAGWDEVNLEKGVLSYFSTRIYNSSAGGGYCDPGYYTVELSLTSEDIEIGQIFDYNVSPAEMFLDNGENRQVLLSLTPKVESGHFTVLVTVKRRPPEAGGTSIISTSTARISILIGNNPDTAYLEKPFWTQRKDCPGGFVVKQGEQCPSKVCLDNSFVYGNGLCPEELEALRKQEEAQKANETVPTGFFGLPVSAESAVGFAGILVAIIAVAGSLLYVQRLKRELKGSGLR